jgi:hypothetical protein
MLLIAAGMTAPVIETCAQRARDGLTLFPRLGTPDEMGAIIATLASRAASLYDGPGRRGGCRDAGPEVLKETDP